MSKIEERPMRDCGHVEPIPGLTSETWLIYRLEATPGCQEFARVELYTGRVILLFSDCSAAANIARNALVCLRSLYERTLRLDEEELAALRVVLAKLEQVVDPSQVF